MAHSQLVKRPVHEYQFLPEQPSARSDGYGRIPSSHLYDPSIDDTGNRLSPLQSGRLFVHDNDRMPIKQGTHHNFPSSSMEYDGYHHKALYLNSGIDAPFSSQHAIGIENPFLTPDRRMNREEDGAPIERKRKVNTYLHKIILSINYNIFSFFSFTLCFKIVSLTQIFFLSIE